MKFMKNNAGNPGNSTPGGNMGEPLRKPDSVSGSKKNRRRKAIQIPMPNRSVAYLVAALLLVSGSVYAAHYLMADTKINDIVITGMNYSSEEDIRAAAGVLPDTPADSVRAIQVIESIEAMPYVREAGVVISALGTMRIHLTERKPIAVLAQGDALVMVDADGIKMELPDGYYPDVPLLYGFDVHPAGDTLNSAAFKQTAGFLKALERSKVASLTVSEVGWHEEDGIFALSRENGVRLVFGKYNFADRLENWEEFYRQVVPQKGMTAFTSLDFRFEGQVVAHEI